MKLIEQYVYAVTRYLPEKNREDIRRELKANIEEMLPDTPTEAEVRQVLEELGNPQLLANEYSSQKNYLIGPVLFADYLSILKLVVSLVVLTLSALTVLSWGFNPEAGYDLLELFIHLLTAIFNGAIHSAMWVTIVFAILERTDDLATHLPLSHKRWSLDELPELPQSMSKKFSRVDLGFEALFSIIALSVFYSFPHLIAIHQEGRASIPLFMMDQLQRYLPLVIILTGLQLALMGWKWVAKHWNLKLAIANGVFHLSYAILSVVMLHDPRLFNSEFFNYVEAFTLFSFPLASVISALVIVISAFEMFTGFRHAYLSQRKINK